MLRNPLIPSPPNPHGRRHELGSRTKREIQEVFCDLGDEICDVHYGVFLSTHPLVSFAYADGRQQIKHGEVVDPPVLIGIRSDNLRELPDTDVMVCAKELLRFAQDSRGFLEPEDETEFMFDGRVRDPFVDFSEMSLAVLGGTVGNLPSEDGFHSAGHALRDLLEEREIHSSESLADLPIDIKEVAIELATKIVPQTRTPDEISSKDVQCIYVIPPILDPQEPDRYEYFPGISLEDEFNSTELSDMLLEDLDDFLLRIGTPIYKKPDASPTFWHGTSLSIARKAFPDIVTAQRYHEGLHAGFPLEEPEEEEEPEDEDE